MGNIVIRARNLITDISIKWYEKELQNKPHEEVQIFMARKVKLYLVVCGWGIGTLFLGNGITSLELVKKADPRTAYVCVVFFLVSLLFMCLGAANGYVPTSTNWQAGVELTGFGAWVTAVRTIAWYHLDTFDFHPDPQLKFALSSFSTTTVVVTFYWGFVMQDPRFMHVIVKLLWYFCKLLFGIIWWVVKLPWSMGKLIWRSGCWVVGLAMATGVGIGNIFSQLWASARGRAGYSPIQPLP